MAKNMTLVSREEIDFAPGENTFGTKIFKAIWRDEDGKKKNYWSYGKPDVVMIVGLNSDGNIVAEEAKNYIYGYTIGNDVTARDLQRTDDQWTRAKGFDTFCPFGPWIDTDFDISDAIITCKVNGAPRQMASTRDMVFNVPTLIAYISSVMTLEPGDLIFTGTPSGVGKLEDGNEVVVEIEGLGTLKNLVKAER